MKHMSEKQVENLILNWLKWKKLFFWKVKTVGTYDEKLGRFMKTSPLYMTGVSDILGILDDGTLVAIEVKSKIGKLAPHQKAFLDEIKKRGGVAFVARSLECVEAELSKHIGGLNERHLVTPKLRTLG